MMLVNGEEIEEITVTDANGEVLLTILENEDNSERGIIVKSTYDSMSLLNSGNGINVWRDVLHDNSIKHGWWEEERSFGEIIALCHSELSEALEEYRDGKPMLYYNCVEAVQCGSCDTVCDPQNGLDCAQFENKDTCGYRINKPKGIAVELIDCMIRILDYCGHAGIDVEHIMQLKHEYNKTRPYKHGGKVI